MVAPSGKNFGPRSASLSNQSCKSLKGLSVSNKASASFSFEIAALAKQLPTV